MLYIIGTSETDFTKRTIVLETVILTSTCIIRRLRYGEKLQKLFYLPKRESDLMA